jgi:hypothetical protein
MRVYCIVDELVGTSLMTFLKVLVALLGLSVGLVVAQDTATPETPITETPTLDAPTETPTPTPTELPTSTPTETPSLEATLELTAEATTEATPEPSPTLYVIPTFDLLTLTPTATPTATQPPVVLFGVVRYQNRMTDLERVRVTAYDEQGQVVALAQMGVDGRFEIEIPQQIAYHLLITAPLHQTLHYVSDNLPNPFAVILPGGDLDGDGCVLTDDLTLLTTLYDTADLRADINGDGWVSVVDLSILAGNMQELCAPWMPLLPITATVTPTEEAIAEETAESTESPTDLPTPTETPSDVTPMETPLTETPTIAETATSPPTETPITATPTS